MRSFSGSGDSAERVLDHAFEEQPAAFARSKERTFDEAFQLGLNLSRRERLCWRAVGNSRRRVAAHRRRGHGIYPRRSVSQVSQPLSGRFVTAKNCKVPFGQPIPR